MKITLNPPRVIETDRLVLRTPVLQDAPAIFHSYASKPNIPKFMSWLPHTKIYQTDKYIAGCISAWESGSDYVYSIELRDKSSEPIGMIGMHPLKHTVGFGYVVAEEHWNRGLTTEALSQLVQWSLTQDVIYRAQAFCDCENTASARVMEKAGMKFEGVLRRYLVHPNISQEPRDSLMYAKIK